MNYCLKSPDNLQGNCNVSLDSRAGRKYAHNFSPSHWLLPEYKFSLLLAQFASPTWWLAI
jgi:hypothetical protein